MATKIIDDTVLQDIAVAIQSKDNGGKMLDTQMAGRIDALITASNMMEGNLTNYTDNVVTTLRRGAFYYYTNLQSVSFENVVSTGIESFRYCTSLVDVNMPNLENIGVSTFNICPALSNVYIPKATTLNNACFASCGLLKRLDLPNVEVINSQVFLNDNRLTIVTLGKRATLSSSDFMPANIVFYVQEDDFTWYQNETNWSALYAEGKIKSINDLPS